MARHAAAVLGEAVRAAAGNAPASDRELLERFAAGEQAAFAALFRRHAGMVLGVCRRALPRVQDAEDACQATFLVLSRKAGSGRWQRSVANWLYLTARRVASNARLAAERRARNERRAAVPEAVPPVDRMTGRELLATLDKELERLPPRYREPLVLCYLQGLTRDEAAARLGVPTATLKSRLERGRKQLGDALTGRGCTFGAGLLAAAAVSRASASPPRLLQAVLTSAAGTPPPDVAELAGGLAAGGVGKAKLAALLALAGAVVLGVGLGAGRPGDAGQAPAKAMPAKAAPADAKAIAPKGAAEPGKDVTLTGRVLDPDGKPLSGARLLLLGNSAPPADLGASGADGRFGVTVPRVHTRDTCLAAQAEGLGFDFLPLDRVDAAAVELRLVKDNPIRGRVLDTQGKPVAGARVAVRWLSVYPNDSLDSFLVAWKKRHPHSGIPAGVKGLWTQPEPLFPATTDAEGRFTLRGLGAERLVALRLSKEGIAESEYWVVNRGGFDPGPYNEASRNNVPVGLEDFTSPWLLYGPELALVAEAEKPIRGVVTAADTGKGRPGVEVRSARGGNGLVLLPFGLSAKTDAAGRYEIRGARKAASYTLEVAGDDGAGYMPCQVRAADTPGYEPVTADFRVAKGVIVTGRVLDKSTGKGVPGVVMAGVLNGNPFAKDYPTFNKGSVFPLRETADDGSFRVVAIPGPVLLMGGPDGNRLPDGWETRFRYKHAVPDPKYPQYFPRRPLEGAYQGYGGAYLMIQGNWCKVLEIKPGTAVVEQDVLLEPAAALPLRLRDPEGRPLAGVLVAGTPPQDWHAPVTCKTDTCTVYDLEPGKPRLLVFLEPKRKLSATLTLKDDEKAPVAVTLRPAGAVRGRLVGGDGKPLAGVAVSLNYKDRPAEEVHKATEEFRQVVTGADGAFVVDGVFPGLPFDLAFKSRKPLAAATKAGARTVASGETKDLGDLAVKPDGGRKSE